MNRLLVFFFALAFLACAEVDSQTLLQPKDFQQRIAQQTGLILDVRTQEEFGNGHLVNATNLDIYDKAFEKKLDGMDKSKAYYVYCQRGPRSANAVDILAKKGFQNVYELKGGFESWKKEKLPIEGQGTHGHDGELTVEQYDTLVAKGVVLVDFSAKWCGPCKKMAPVLHKMQKERAADFKLVEIDVDENEAVAKYNSVELLPTLAWYKEGKLVKRVFGFQSEKSLYNALDEVLKK